MNPTSLSIVTCSYGPDATRCKRLCQSIDRFVPQEVEHVLIVPKRDAALFRSLVTDRRRLLFTEDVVPGNYRQLPLLNRWWIDKSGWPVRGWIMQQVTKLSVNAVVTSDNILFADSDLQFIRPMHPDTLMQDGKLRLHRQPGAASTGRHLAWHGRAAQLLGLESGYLGSDYIGQLITWRREHLVGLQHALEAKNQKPWHQLVARSTHFSEYILYGAYVEHVVGMEHSGQYGCDKDICHCCWFSEQAEEITSTGFSINENALAILLQSNLKLSNERENELLQLAQQHAKPGTI